MFDMMTSSIYVAGLAFCFMPVYLANITTGYLRSSNAATALKALPVVLLAVSAFLSRNAPNVLFKRYCVWIAVGLLFGSCGDILLDQSKSFFLPGLASFLLGHICYVIAFSMGLPLLKVSIYAIVPYSAAVVMYGVLCPSLPIADIVPVGVYCLTIATMCAKSFVRLQGPFHSRGVWCSIVGSISFLASDSMLSYTIYKHKFAYHDVFVMVTYYIGQLCIGLSACDVVSGDVVPKQLDAAQGEHDGNKLLLGTETAHDTPNSDVVHML